VSQAVVFDVGRVLFQWQLGSLFEKLIADRDELDWFLANVVTEEWHFEHDSGRALADMLPERIALFPQYEAHIRAYAMRFNETVPGPVEGTHAIVERLAGKGVPLFCLTNFGEEFWDLFRPTQPVFDHFADIIVSGHTHQKWHVPISRERISVKMHLYVDTCHHLKLGSYKKLDRFAGWEVEKGFSQPRLGGWWLELNKRRIRGGGIDKRVLDVTVVEAT
jgi:hypothetical protein